MELFSTGDASDIVSFSEAALRGSGAGGGLYMPTSIPRLKDVQALLALPFVERSKSLCRQWIGDEFSEGEIDEIITSAFTFPIPMVDLGGGLHICELFHGPTLAFKDFGARFMAQVLGVLAKRQGERRPITILTATSGDTGAAVAHAFYKVPGVSVCVLYPKGRISPLQERLFTTLGENVTTFAVEGNFDDCQRMVKACFADETLSRGFGLTSANSINMARLLAQSFYYFEAASALQGRGEQLFAVPSGNFGNMTAGLLATRMGLPIKGFVAATNANDVVPAFLRTGTYTPRPSVATLSNAMDVGSPSNFERIRALFGDDDTLRSAIKGEVVTDAQTRASMVALYEDHGYLACPHTAVGVAALKRRGGKGVVLATAHPAKFKEVVDETLGVDLPLPEALAKVADLTPGSHPLTSSPSALPEALRALMRS